MDFVHSAGAASGLCTCSELTPRVATARVALVCVRSAGAASGLCSCAGWTACMGGCSSKLLSVLSQRARCKWPVRVCCSESVLQFFLGSVLCGSAVGSLGFASDGCIPCVLCPSTEVLWGVLYMWCGGRTLVEEVAFLFRERLDRQVSSAAAPS